jgi:hypothetical protein
MKRKILLIDTETVGLKPNNLVYDIAWVITDKQGNIYDQQSYLVREIITDGKKMRRAFFTDRIFSHYIPELDRGTIRLADWSEIVGHLREAAALCDVLAAYNLPFDMSAVKRTSQDCGQTQPVYSKKPVLLCLWRFACGLLFASKKYHMAARNQGWVSDAGNYRTTAEHAFKYITGQWDFEESHTAREDAEIERQIMTRLFARKKKIPYNDLSPFPWKLAQEAR